MDFILILFTYGKRNKKYYMQSVSVELIEINQANSKMGFIRDTQFIKSLC